MLGLGLARPVQYKLELNLGLCTELNLGEIAQHQVHYNYKPSHVKSEKVKSKHEKVKSKHEKVKSSREHIE